MSIFKKVHNAGIWQTIETIINVFAQFLYMAIMARILNKSDFGLMAIANSLIVSGYIFAQSGMGFALIQRKDITYKHINAALQGGGLVGIILFLIFFFLAPSIAIFFEQPELENIIKIIAINFLVVSISAVSLGILQKQFRFKEQSIVTILSVILSYSFGIFLGIRGFGVWSLVIASLLLSVLKAIGFFHFAKIKLAKGLFFREWRELFSFGFGIMLLQINNYMGKSGIMLVLGKIFNPTLLGVFERTFTIKTLPSSYIGNILDAIMFPAMSEIQDEHERLFKIFQHSLGIVNSLLMPIALYLFFFTGEIVLIILGENWSDAVRPLQIMFIVLPFSTSVRMADAVLRAKGLVYENAGRKFLYVLVLVLTTSFGAYYHGLIGAAFGVTISILFNYITMLLLVKKVFQKSINEIFLLPLWAGMKLSVSLLVILIITTSIFNFWGTVNIEYYLLITLLLGMLTIILLRIKPAFFGKYLCSILERLKSKDRII